MPNQRVDGELEINLAGKTMYVRGVWVKKKNDQYHFYLNELKPDIPISIGGAPMRVIAVEVHEGDRQRASNSMNEIVLQNLGQISPHGTPFETCMIDRKNCVLCMIPYTR